MRTLQPLKPRTLWSAGNKKSAFMPGMVVDLPAMSDKDRADIRWGVENDIDYIAASYIRKATSWRSATS